MKLKDIQMLCPDVVKAECDAVPEEVAYEGERLQYLNQYIQSLIDEELIWSGSYCL